MKRRATKRKAPAPDAVPDLDDVPTKARPEPQDAMVIQVPGPSCSVETGATMLDPDIEMEETQLQTELQTVDDGQNVSAADRFYRDLDARDLTIKLNADELEDLQSAVHEFILQILDRVVNIDARFKCGVIRVGSSVEGTKILEPDEFDYLVVIDELSKRSKRSKRGVVSSVRCGEERPGYMTLQITDEKTQERWKDYCEDGHLLGFVFRSSQNEKNKLSKAVGFSSLIKQVFENQWKVRPILISKRSGTLKFTGVSAYTDPNTVIQMLWFDKRQGIAIKADISPAVRCYNVTQAVNLEDCGYPIFYTKIQEHGSYLLTPGGRDWFKATQYFRISLTEVEVDIVKSLDTTHKRCYRVLKYIFIEGRSRYEIPTLFSSYVLKSAVLHHVADGQCQSSEVHKCVESVVRSLLNYITSDKQFTEPFMPSVFIKGHNLFNTLSRFKDKRLLEHSIEEFVKWQIESLMIVLNFTQKLCKIPKDNHDYASKFQMLEDVKIDIYETHVKMARTIL